MNEQQKHKLILNVKSFYVNFQKEILDLIPDNNNSELSPLLYKMLHEIHLEGTITSSVLSKRLTVSIPNTSRSIHRLAELGYIIKIKDESDKRITHLSFSQKGFSLVESSMKAVDEVFLKKLDVLSLNEIEQLSEAFSIVRDLMIKIRNLNKL